jgi:hypothetical protein
VIEASLGLTVLSPRKRFFQEEYLLVVGWFYENRIFYSLRGSKFEGMKKTHVSSRPMLYDYTILLADEIVYEKELGNEESSTIRVYIVICRGLPHLVGAMKVSLLKIICFSIMRL